MARAKPQAEASLDGKAARSRDIVQSLIRGLEVIASFGPDHQQQTLSDVARRTGLTPASARRFLHTLMAVGYVRADGRYFTLSPRVLELGYAYLSGLSLTDVALPHVQDLASRVRESCSVAVLDGNDIVYIIRVPIRRIMTVSISVGTRFPAYATSLGRALLASLEPEELEERLAETTLLPITDRTVSSIDDLRAILDQVRLQGFAINNDEMEVGLRSAAVPLRNRNKQVVAAINTSTQAARVSLETLRRKMVPELIKTAHLIESELVS